MSELHEKARDWLSTHDSAETFTTVGATLIRDLLAENERLANDLEDQSSILAIYRDQSSKDAHRLRELQSDNERLRSADTEWLEKTAWVQDGINSGQLPPRYLGWHRADVIKSENERLNERVVEGKRLIADDMVRLAERTEQLLKERDRRIVAERRLRELASAEPVAYTDVGENAWSRRETEWHNIPLIRRPVMPK